MTCRIAYIVNGLRAHTTVNAPSTTDALLMVLRHVPDGARVAAMVSVVRSDIQGYVLHD